MLLGFSLRFFSFLLVRLWFGWGGGCVRKASKVRTLSPREVRFSPKNSSFIVALAGFVVVVVVVVVVVAVELLEEELW